jgi:ribosomal protein L37AE/L43A
MNVPSSLFPRFGEISELVKKGATLEAQKSIMELKEVVLELQEQNLLLRNENSELKENIKASSEKLIWEKPFYWLQKNENHKEGPFCQQCYDSVNKAIRLIGNGRGFWECKTCKNNYTDDTYAITTSFRSSPRSINRSLDKFMEY